MSKLYFRSDQYAKENGQYVMPRHGSSGTGFPWSGYEIHTRNPSNTDVQYILTYTISIRFSLIIGC